MPWKEVWGQEREDIAVSFPSLQSLKVWRQKTPKPAELSFSSFHTGRESPQLWTAEETKVYSWGIGSYCQDDGMEHWSTSGPEVRRKGIQEGRQGKKLGPSRERQELMGLIVANYMLRSKKHLVLCRQWGWTEPSFNSLETWNNRLKCKQESHLKWKPIGWSFTWNSQNLKG